MLELANIERRGDLLKLLTLLAGRTAGLLVPGTLAGQSGIPRTTLVRYLELLSSVFLIKTIPAWSSGQTHRAIGTPKLAFVDTGIVCHLLGQDPDRLGEPGGAAGSAVENFVLMELARQLTWSEERGRLYHGARRSCWPSRSCPGSSSERNDRVRKVGEYATVGIPQYWIVDHHPDPRVQVLRLGQHGYVADSAVGAGTELVGEIEADRPFGVSFDPAALLEF